MTKLTPDELKTLEELDAKATPAPWQLGEDDVNPELMTGPRNTEGSFNYIGNGYDRTDDAFDNKLCVAVRNALPRLLAHIRTLESDLDAARRELESERIEKHAPTDNAPTRARILDIIRNAFGPRAGHGDCKRYAKGFKCCQICGATDELRTIAKDWKGHRITAARAANPMESKP